MTGHAIGAHAVTASRTRGLGALINPQPWASQGNCATLTPQRADMLFFGDGRNRGHIAQAKAMCATCPVLEQCRSFGEQQEYGLYGGVTECERNGVSDAVA